MSDTLNKPIDPRTQSAINDDAAFERGDCRAVHLGEIRLEDGRVFWGVILEFPCGLPKLPLSTIFKGSPLTLSIKTSADQTAVEPDKDAWRVAVVA